MRKIFGTSQREGGNEWLSVADMMAGLMVIFLFIAIIYIRPLAQENRQLVQLSEQLEQKKAQLEKQNTQIAEIAVTWQEREQQIYQALYDEFRADLPRWNAEIEEATLIFRFKSPDVLFEKGDNIIRPIFKDILSDFFPRYVAVLKPFRASLDEIRIEGHTSSEWQNAPPARAYIQNMRLSQGRTRAVLEFVLGLKKILNERRWVQAFIVANGLSSSRLILTAKGSEDRKRSRRVEFRVRTTVHTEIVKILEATQQ